MGAQTVTDLRFPGGWRHYQELAFDAFDADREAGRRRTHLVAPPGSGKTVMGVELVRRCGRPALVLVPNQAVQQQWLATLRACGGEGLLTTDPEQTGRPVTVLTYQALCRLEDPGAALRDVAVGRWVAERAAATGEPPDAVAAASRAWTGEAARRREGQIGRIVAAIKREVARGEHPELELGDLLDRGARARVDALRARGTGTVVLDECHHLASLWGYVVRAVLAELLAEQHVHVIGLTATPPQEMSTDEADLYEAILGPVDFSVPTPAVVRDGFLAPYQELAWFCEPLASERAWLAEHDVRFAELITALHDDEGAGDVLPFPEWVIRRMRHRGAGEGDDEIPWASFQQRRPALARAGVRFLLSAGLPPPTGAPRGESFREPPDLDDWIVLLEDYAMHALSADPSPQAAARFEAVAAALRDLGFTLTRTGIRRGRSEVDRLLTRSAAKPLALVEVLATEQEARGPALRGCVLCDAERAERRADAGLVGVLDPAAGTAVRAVVALADDVRTAPLRPLLVSGRALRCVPADHDALVAALGLDRPAPPVVDDDGLVELRPADGAGWAPRVWVARATAALAGGSTGVLVGTRALLGEGWDAPCVNVLVDLTVATTGVSVRQMRGRSLRLDPEQPEKIASNWDVVCLAPDLVRGSADYRRFVRKHVHLLAPAEDGVIEAGPSHVHPDLSPFAPPPARTLAEIDVAMRARAADHAAARERWAIGTPYEAVERSTVTVRPARDGEPLRTGALAPGRELHLPIEQRGPLALAGTLGAGAVVGALVAPAALAGLALTPLALGWAAVRLRRSAELAPPLPPLDAVARAVVEAYEALGEFSPEVAASLVVEPRASGYLRCRLRAGTAPQAALLSTAIEQLLGVVETPRYAVSRPMRVPGRGPLRMLGEVLRRRDPLDVRWHAVPADLARRRDRAQAFHAAWVRAVGRSELRFVQRSDEARQLGALVAAGAADYEVSARQVWS